MSSVSFETPISDLRVCWCSVSRRVGVRLCFEVYDKAADAQSILVAGLKAGLSWVEGFRPANSGFRIWISLNSNDQHATLNH